MRIRPPAVAGTFYPNDPDELRAMLRACLEAAARPGADDPVPKAVIAPHAGYVYSGPVAASIYARLAPQRGRIRRVVLLGPAHRVWVRGLAAPGVDAFETPLGRVPLDRDEIDRALRLPQVETSDAAHADEHSLEVHVPFLQVLLGEFSLFPLLVGDATPDQVCEVIDLVWGGPETLVVISSDLSHYYDYATACRLDEATSRAIESLSPEEIDTEQACGRVPVQGLLLAARRRAMTAEIVDVRNSGDTAGTRDSVVGYGAYAFR